MRLTVVMPIVLIWSSLAYGQDNDTVSPERPRFSSSSDLVPGGHIQLEGGSSRVRYGKSSGYHAGEVLIRFGLSDRIEMRAAVPSYIVVSGPVGRVSGASDTLVESKIRFRSGDRASFGVLASAVLPSGTLRVAEHTFQPGATLISDLKLRKFVGVTTNVGYSRATKNGQRYNYTYAVSTINVTLQGNMSVFTEVYIYHQQTGPVQKYVATGVAWTLAKRTAFDINAGVGLPHNGVHGPDHYFGIGISHLF